MTWEAGNSILAPVVMHVVMGVTGEGPVFLEMIKVEILFEELINSGAATLVLKQKAIEQGMHFTRRRTLNF